MNNFLTDGQRKFLWTVVISIIAMRLISLGLYPLYDTTEPRYAEIARKMIVMNDWITPHLYFDTPFWGKPPMSFWMGAISMKIFGVNEFGARFASFFVMALSALLVFKMTLVRYGKDISLLTQGVLWTTPVFFMLSGAVLTDPFLTLGTTMTMVSFWLVMKADEGDKKYLWRYLLFVGLAISMLSKGPIGIVLSAMPIGLYVIIKNKWAMIWNRIPWIQGTLLTALISLPWYFLAEMKTPGFIDYFIVGEHFRRFVDKDGWKGDLYGKAHTKMYGSIWGFWLTATLPWCIHFFGGIVSKFYRTTVGKLILEKDDDFIYFLLWATAPAIFFSVSASILIPYVLPGVPAFAILFGYIVMKMGDKATESKGFVRSFKIAALVTPVLCIGAMAAFLSGFQFRETHKTMAQEYLKMRGEGKGKLIYLSRRKFSGEFYTKGQITAMPLNNKKELKATLNNDIRDYFTIEYHDARRVDIKWLLDELEYLGRYSRKNYWYHLYREKQ